MENRQDSCLPKLEIEHILSRCGFLKIDVWPPRNYLFWPLKQRFTLSACCSIKGHFPIPGPGERNWEIMFSSAADCSITQFCAKTGTLNLIFPSSLRMCPVFFYRWPFCQVFEFLSLLLLLLLHHNWFHSHLHNFLGILRKCW